MDFGMRVEIFKGYYSQSGKKKVLDEGVRKGLKEKVRIQNETRDLIGRMEKGGGLKYANVLKIVRTLKTVTKLRQDSKSEGNLNSELGYVNDQARKISGVGNCHLSSLEWAQRLDEQQRLEQDQEVVLSSLSHKLLETKNAKRRHKYRLKNLYMELLSQPPLLHENGLCVEDILTFMKVTLGIILDQSMLSDIFNDCEKEY
jgi:hypothetical protein